MLCFSGIVLVLLDDPGGDLKTCKKQNKFSFKKSKLPPCVSQTKQQLLCLINQMLSSAEFEKDLFSCIGLKITKKIFNGTKSMVSILCDINGN